MIVLLSVQSMEVMGRWEHQFYSHGSILSKVSFLAHTYVGISIISFGLSPFPLALAVRGLWKAVSWETDFIFGLDRLSV